MALWSGTFGTSPSAGWIEAAGLYQRPEALFTQRASLSCAAVGICLGSALPLGAVRIGSQAWPSGEMSPTGLLGSIVRNRTAPRSRCHLHLAFGGAGFLCPGPWGSSNLKLYRPSCYNPSSGPWGIAHGRRRIALHRYVGDGTADDRSQSRSRHKRLSARYADNGKPAENRGS